MTHTNQLPDHVRMGLRYVRRELLMIRTIPARPYSIVCRERKNLLALKVECSKAKQSNGYHQVTGVMAACWTKHTAANEHQMHWKTMAAELGSEHLCCNRTRQSFSFHWYLNFDMMRRAPLRIADFRAVWLHRQLPWVWQRTSWS